MNIQRLGNEVLVSQAFIQRRNMPSSRAILNDLTEKGLDARKPHSRISRDGRLDPDLKHLPTTKVEEPSVVAVVHVEMVEPAPNDVSQQHEQVEEKPSIELVKKPNRFVKKNALQKLD